MAQFFFLVFSHEHTQSFTAILGTVVIGILINSKDYGIIFGLVVVIYALLLFLSSWATSHMRSKVKDVRTFQDAIYEMSNLLRTWSIKLQKCASRIKEARRTNPNADVKVQLNEINFQSAAFAVCEELKRFLTTDERETVYVTVYQAYKDSGQSKCKMIAYSGNHEPTSYNNAYDIPAFSEDLYGKIDFHTYLFSSGHKDISVLANSVSVSKAFVPHPGTESRMKSIQQYIGIPIAPTRQGVLFLLQVDTKIPGYFGDSEETVREFAENTVYPYAQFLHMIYEESRAIVSLTNDD